jgi:hypothetical protein
MRLVWFRKLYNFGIFNFGQNLLDHKIHFWGLKLKFLKLGFCHTRFQGVEPSA